MRKLVAFSAVIASMMSAFSLLLLPSAATAQALQTDDLQRYTHHPGNAAPGRSIALALDGPFAPDERVKILRAIAEWNHALNGFIRFDVLPPGRGGFGAWNLQA